MQIKTLIANSKKPDLDMQLSGQGNSGYIEGIVTSSGVAVVRRVLCYHRYSGRLIGETTSDEEGRYRINNLQKETKYFLVSINDKVVLGEANLVVNDLVTATEIYVPPYPEGPDDVEP